MFAAVASDLGSPDHRSSVHQLLLQYGFKKMQENLFESTTISDAQLQRLKKELDRLTDSYDTLRIYQYPVEDTLVISSLKEKRWRRMVLTTAGRGV